MKLAPIAVSVYTRLKHFKLCIEALQNNDLADKSELFVYSDAAKERKAKFLVQEVRSFAHSITGFKKVHIIEREKNYGGTKNAFWAYEEITKKFGKSIFLEDDIVTAPGFLTFLNEALVFYKNDSRILSITGYCPPLEIPHDLKRNFFVLRRYCGWGCGSFSRTIDIAAQQVKKQDFGAIQDKTIFTLAGPDILEMIKKEVEGELDAGDVRCMYHQALNKMYTIYPVKSLVQNIGHDGTGIHCGINTKFQIKELWDKTGNFEFFRDIEENESIIKANFKFRSPGIRDRVINFSKTAGIFPMLKLIKNAIKK